MFRKIKGFWRKRKKVLSLIAFFLFVVTIPLAGYFMSTDRSFDDRGRARSLDFEFIFSVKPSEVRRGEEATLSWSAPGAYRCWGFDGWTDRKELVGTEVVSPQYSTVYGMSCNRDNYELTRWVVLNVEGSSVRRSCSRTDDCYRNPPYEICHNGFCLLGDIKNDGRIGMADFEEFKKDYINFQMSGWNEDLKRSDLNLDMRLSMDDYSIFVNSYREFNNLN